jgi:flagellar hook-length control protein FliK
MAPPAAANAKGDSSAKSSGEQSGQNMPSPGGDERLSSKVTRPAGGQPAPGGQAATAASAAGTAQVAPGATSANGVPLVQIGQLADFVAGAAGAMDSQSGDASGLAKAGDGASAASMAPVKELDVQLNPKSLGALSIQMRLSNGKLNITINAENADTLKLVGNVRGAISDRLKSLNFSVESITVNALDMAASTGASGEAAQSGTPGHGETYQDQSGQTADGSTRGGRSFQGDGDPRNPSRPSRSGLGEPGGDGNPGHRFI